MFCSIVVLYIRYRRQASSRPPIAVLKHRGYQSTPMRMPMSRHIKAPAMQCHAMHLLYTTKHRNHKSFPSIQYHTTGIPYLMHTHPSSASKKPQLHVQPDVPLGQPLSQLLRLFPFACSACNPAIVGMTGPLALAFPPPLSGFTMRDPNWPPPTEAFKPPFKCPPEACNPRVEPARAASSRSLTADIWDSNLLRVSVVLPSCYGVAYSATYL